MGGGSQGEAGQAGGKKKQKMPASLPALPRARRQKLKKFRRGRNSGGCKSIIPNDNSGRSKRSNRKVPVTRTSRYQLPPENFAETKQVFIIVPLSCSLVASLLSRKRRYDKQEVVTLLASSATANTIYHDWCEYNRWECCTRLVIDPSTATRGGPLVCSLRCRAQ